MLRDREIADALGDLCDGRAVAEQARAAARAALDGPVYTADRGARRYYVDLDTMALDNVDTSEGIWSVPADGLLRGPDGAPLFDLADDRTTFSQGVFALEALRDRRRFACIQGHWAQSDDPARRAAWRTFVERVAAPLCARLRAARRSI